MRRIVLTIIGLVVAFVHISAQDDPQYRMEIGAGVGMVSYEGDFNGNVLKTCSRWPRCFGDTISTLIKTCA